eukprot:CAMPEP_0170489062 /NCGR_PEP_ID=MMETSP0208-20121228/7470_1 /TAXON_ID=197538 /ORGANISM="Strombidium inclinatum, Strain S3" /LENGTH=96 /DNA_ID=CAMNT_0010763825 /DNA_START=124 /DNA_END=414 /DNA_ORIENTATION=-
MEQGGPLGDMLRGLTSEELNRLAVRNQIDLNNSKEQLIKQLEALQQAQFEFVRQNQRMMYQSTVQHRTPPPDYISVAQTARKNKKLNLAQELQTIK